MTENEILEGLIQNKRETYEYVYKTFGPPVLKYVLKNKGNREDAKDLFQEVLLKAILQIRNGKYDQRNKFEAWFLRIARNTWIDHLRETKPYLLGDDGFLLQLADDSDDEALLHLILHDRRLEKLSNIWESWTDTMCRRILHAFYFDKARTKDIAEAENIKQGNVLVKLLRCKEKLFKLMDEGETSKQ